MDGRGCSRAGLAGVAECEAAACAPPGSSPLRYFANDSPGRIKGSADAEISTPVSDSSDPGRAVARGAKRSRTASCRSAPQAPRWPRPPLRSRPRPSPRCSDPPRGSSAGVARVSPGNASKASVGSASPVPGAAALRGSPLPPRPRRRPRRPRHRRLPSAPGAPSPTASGSDSPSADAASSSSYPLNPSASPLGSGAGAGLGSPRLPRRRSPLLSASP